MRENRYIELPSFEVGVWFYHCQIYPHPSHLAFSCDYMDVKEGGHCFFGWGRCHSFVNAPDSRLVPSPRSEGWETTTDLSLAWGPPRLFLRVHHCCLYHRCSVPHVRHLARNFSSSSFGQVHGVTAQTWCCHNTGIIICQVVNNVSLAHLPSSHCVTETLRWDKRCDFHKKGLTSIFSVPGFFYFVTKQ